MARFQNGLYISHATNTGLTVSRWFVEFTTQILGWTLHDSNDAGYASTIADASDISTTANSNELDFSTAAYSPTLADIGRYVTMLGNAGWSDSEKEKIGIYRIINVDEVTEIVYVDILRGVHEDGLPSYPGAYNIHYRLWDSTATYVPAINKYAVVRTPYLHGPAEPNMDIYIQSNAAAGGHPYIAIGPFGTWNSATHVWNDTRNTTPILYATSTALTTPHIWAVGDDDYCVMILKNNTASEPLSLYYVGAIEPTAGTTIDTNPGVIIAGYTQIGYCSFGQPNGNTIYEGARWMAYNGGTNNVSVSGGPMVPQYIVGDSNLAFSVNRTFSQWSGNIYRVEIMLRSTAIANMETRGITKGLWMCNRYTPLTSFGTDPNFFLHTNGGVAIKWNGSKAHVQWSY